MDNTLGPRVGKGVIGIGPSLERRLPCVDIVAGGRTGGGRLEAVVEAHALRGEAIHMRSVGLAPIAAYIEIAEIVGQNENEVGFGNR